MKIGIITVPDAANFGSFLQAYSLQTVLEELGHDVCFINGWDSKYVRKLYCNWIPKKRHLKHPYIFIAKNLFWKKERAYFLENQKKLKLSDGNGENDYDLVLLGSDEIWNVKTEVFTKAAFYGGCYQNAAAFAVSAGEADYTDFLRYPDIIEYIRNIADIYVRDDNTADIVKKITGKTPLKVCDPTFLVNKEELSDSIENEYLKSNRYIAVYSYSMSIPKQNVDIIKKYARSNGCRLVSVGMYNEWCDYNLLCAPLQFSAVLQGAEAVITNTFHGTVFSVLNEKKFAVIGNKIKICDLLKEFNLDSQRIETGRMSLELLTETLQNNFINYNIIEEKIQKIRLISSGYLKKIIDKQ